MASRARPTEYYKKTASKICQRGRVANKSESLCTHNIIKKTVCQAFFLTNGFFVMQQNFDYYDFKKARILS